MKRIRNIGIDSNLEADVAKRVRIVNIMSIITIIMGLLILPYTILINWPIVAILFISGIIISSIIPLVLNYIKKYHLAIIYYLVSGYFIILTLSILFGSALHYQYFLFTGIGMPLIFIKSEMKFLRWSLSLLSIVLWGYLVLHFTIFEPILSINQNYVFYTQLINDFLVFVVLFSMIFLFTKENDNHLDEIESKTIKLSESNVKLEQFSYIVSHDLKSPLSNIDSLISIIEEDYSKELSEDANHIFSMIKESSIRLNRLISSILEYTRAGEGTSSFTTFNLYNLLEGISSLIEIPEKLKLHYNSDLPNIHGSFIQLEQVFINLIGNAIKYHDKDEGLIKINIILFNSDFLRIEVVDNGPGIKSQYYEVIFEMFGSANEVSRTDSSGLGLSIVKKIVELNHGEVGLESEYEKGSCFWFTWPLNIESIPNRY